MVKSAKSTLKQTIAVVSTARIVSNPFQWSSTDVHTGTQTNKLTLNKTTRKQQSGNPFDPPSAHRSCYGSKSLRPSAGNRQGGGSNVDG